MELNQKQKEAVEATEGMVRVVAGAGSGKTRVLAHRFAYLVNELGISPGNILCLTFTNKAAQEMKNRISSMVDRGSVNDFVCTIHSFCVKFLRREIYRIGYPKNFLILDESDAKELATQAMNEFGINRKKTTSERFLKGVAAFKGYDPDAYIQKYLLPGGECAVPDATCRYLKLQLKQFALDYDDLVYFTIHILTHFREARDYWTEKLNYVMVDEVQDLSGDDWKLMRLLTSHHGNLFIVGDPDQAIYEWRGGNPRIFVEFRADTDIILNQNYRSTPDILSVANSIIENNRNRVPKELFTVKLNELQPVYRHFKNETEESAFIAEKIEQGKLEGNRFSDYAVLYRASHLSRRIEQELLKRKIPYTVWGGVRFYERKEIKDTICYLRLLASDSDDLAFTRIVNIPSRKFGSATLKVLKNLADESGLPLMGALREFREKQVFRKKPVQDFIDLIDEGRTYASALAVSDLTELMMSRSGLTDMYRKDEEEERLENVSELINSMKEFERTSFEEEEKDLEHYLHEISLYVNTDHEKDSERVRLMTIHQSKGLEFPTVFICGMTEGIFPSHRSIRERRRDGEEEERRLAYVAVTRSEKMLYMTESEGYLNDNGSLKYPSRFISEVKEGLLRVEGDPDPALFEGTRNMISRLTDELGEEPEQVMETGAKVRHKVFGIGVVEGYDAQTKSYKVKFDGKVRQLIGRVLEKI